MTDDTTQPRRGYPPKSEWGPGPWQDEPDRLEWRHKGVPCLMRRGPLSGAWCGYAAVEPGHPWHGKADADEPDVRVHGGVTFAGRCHEDICRVPEPGESDDVWWFGFDCAHAGDVQPGMAARMREYDVHLPADLRTGSSWFGDGVYRDLAYVRAETERLADQIIAARMA